MAANPNPNAKQTFEQWLATGSLYKPKLFTTAELEQLGDFLQDGEQQFGFDIYCPKCGQASHFTWTPNRIRPRIPASLGGRGGVYGGERPADYHNQQIAPAIEHTQFRCARSAEHVMQFFVRHVALDDPEGIELTKIGQYPSAFDLASPELQRFGKLLDDQDRRELRSAELVAGHGLHVAAFTYLRRVFERRVELAHTAAKLDAGWDEAAYQANVLRMDERIQALRAHLPPFLVQHRNAYGILSKGIHELSEEDCATGYAVMLEGVHLILEQEIEQRSRTEREKRLGGAIAKLSQRLGKK